MSATAPLPRSTPESEGIASSAILAFIDAAERELESLHSFMLLRHGAVVAEGWWEPYAAQHPHMLFSLSKSFTSTAVGLAVAEGRLSVDDRVLDFFPEEAPPVVSKNLKAMRVHHLLSMSTGHAEDTSPRFREREDGDWAKAFLLEPVAYEPGTHFLYNNGASYMLSAIVQRLTGVTLLEYLRPRLLDPLGIERATWETCPRGVNIGGWGLSITTESIARFGQLYLQKGVWNGERLLSEAWVEAATSRQVSNGSSPESDWEQGYGYQFWRCRHGAYRGDGAFGQFCVVMPEQDAVIAITSGLGDMQAVLNLVWKHLLPAFERAPLSPDRQAHARLTQRLGSLKLALPAGARSAALAAKVSGRRYVAEPNDLAVESIAYDFQDGRAVITVRDARGEHTVVCGAGEWVRGTTTLSPYGEQAVAAAGAWAADDTYEATAYFYETPFRLTLTGRFVGDELRFDYALNQSFGPTTFPQIVARAAG